MMPLDGTQSMRVLLQLRSVCQKVFGDRTRPRDEVIN